MLADMTIAEVAAWCTALGGVIGGLITATVAAILKYRKSHLEETQYKDQRIDKGHEFVISTLSGRVSNLEMLLVKSQADHIECLKTQEGFRVTAAVMQKQSDEQSQRLALQEKRMEEKDKEIRELKSRIGVITQHGEMP